MIAALYVERGGTYFGLPDVDPWDEARDARLYAGPHPVVAHPPCTRWCQLAGVVESRYGYKVGDDGGMFEHALSAVRSFGGVLEHPAFSLAWKRFGLRRPDARCWTRDLFSDSWTCEVYQVAYGHPARKRTWLYYVGSTPPAAMRWDAPEATATVGFANNNGGRPMPRLHTKPASRTPPDLRDALLALARDSDLVRSIPGT